MAKSWIVDSKGIAKKVRNATLPSSVPIKDCGAKRECPSCHVWIDNSDVSHEWPGLPAGVKFDPTDVELLEHLAAKCSAGDAKPHVFIDEFIQTLDTDEGICYTHPRCLPGASTDGTSVHFFHKTANAYASGPRKRRKIRATESEETVRWHKTGKTKPVFDITKDNEKIHKGYKKILVLYYKSSCKGSKPVKSNWVMHQYHLGLKEDEREGEYVVSKIFYQQNKGNEVPDNCANTEESEPLVLPYGPKTPKTETPNPPRGGSSSLDDDAVDDNMLCPIAENPDYAEPDSCFSLGCTQKEEDLKPPEYPAGESHALGCAVDDIDEAFLCKEIFSTCEPLDNSIVDGLNDLNDGSYGGLDNINLDSIPDFEDVPFGSQESILGWLNKW